jgi:hypothetical protein
MRTPVSGIRRDDDVHLKKIATRVSYTQKCRPAKGTGERVNIQIIKDTDITDYMRTPVSGITSLLLASKVSDILAVCDAAAAALISLCLIN